jgi:nucleoside-diphosphate-sugar epimerase
LKYSIARIMMNKNMEPEKTAFARTFGIEMMIIRPFNIYGPRQNKGNYAGIIPLTTKRIMANEHPVIFGDGRQTRDFIYVGDTVEAAALFLRTYISRMICPRGIRGSFEEGS